MPVASELKFWPFVSCTVMWLVITTIGYPLVYMLVNGKLAKTPVETWTTYNYVLSFFKHTIESDSESTYLKWKLSLKSGIQEYTYNTLG